MHVCAICLHNLSGPIPFADSLRSVFAAQFKCSAFEAAPNESFEVQPSARVFELTCCRNCLLLISSVQLTLAQPHFVNWLCPFSFLIRLARCNVALRATLEPTPCDDPAHVHPQKVPTETVECIANEDVGESSADEENSESFVSE